jgi:hypothetical protein
MTIYRQGWFLCHNFQTTQAKNLLSQLTKRQSTPFLKNIRFKTAINVLDLYGTRNYNSIWYNKKAGLHFDLLYSKVNELEDEGVNSTYLAHN